MYLPRLLSRMPSRLPLLSALLTVIQRYQDKTGRVASPACWCDVKLGAVDAEDRRQGWRCIGQGARQYEGQHSAHPTQLRGTRGRSPSKSTSGL
jgi:hypothetical protein